MFEDSLFDSGAGRRPRKSATKLVSFAIEVFAIGVLVLLPLIFTQALPKQMWTSVLETPPPPRGAPPPKELQAQTRPVRSNSGPDDKVFREPSRIPGRTLMVRDDPWTNDAPPAAGDFVPGGMQDGGQNPVLTQIAKMVPPSIAKPAPVQKLRVSSGVAAGMLVQQVKPQYPQLAVQARIQGTVVLQAVIGKDGRVHELQLVSGHPMLAPAAMEAVKQWRYRPYLLNGEPVDVDTQINVNFTLGGG
jgi:protein TonB